jgi:hypothetical protein
MEQSQSLGLQIRREDAYASDIAARPVDTGNEAHLDRIGASDENNRYYAGRSLRHPPRRIGSGNHCHAPADKIGSQRGKEIEPATRESIFNGDILPLNESRVTESLSEGLNHLHGRFL